jgi:hypothetical protein
MKWIVKKWICRKVNKTLKQYSSNVDTMRSIVLKWIGRLDNILSTLRFLLAKIEDYKIDDNEIKQTSDAIDNLVKSW